MSTLTHEISFKAWAERECSIHGVGYTTIRQRLLAGKYPGLPVRHVNKRVVLVTVAGPPPPAAPPKPAAGYQKKPPLVRRQSGVCDCGQVAARGDVCNRCREIETNYYNRFVRDRQDSKKRLPTKFSGLTEYRILL